MTMAENEDGLVAFELVAPEQLLFSRPVEMVVVPGEEGDFGVLPGHAPFMSQVRAGVIEIHDGGSVTERIFVAGGFAEVTPERCTVLAEIAMPMADLDRDTVETRRREAETAIDDAIDAAAREAGERALAVARAMAEAIEAQ